MNKIRAIIVDDEPLSLDLLRHYLGDYKHIEIVAQCENGRQAIEKVNEFAPDIMFLDIQMPGLTGFDVIQNLQIDTMPLVVFITAYDEFALKAFDVFAVDYLLKPLDKALLSRAIERCVERLANNQTSNNNKPQIISALRELNSRDNQDNAEVFDGEANEGRTDNEPPKLVIKDRDAITFINQSDIDWVDAAGDYMCVHVAGQTHIMRSTLKALLQQLEPSYFQRVHRSTIVNLTRVEKIIPCTKGEYFLEIGADTKIKVSRNYKEVVKELIIQHENAAKKPEGYA